MMDKLTVDYCPAMYSLNSFYSMLFQSLRDALPGVSLSTTGAFGWRGYRIDSYKNLANCQYYCEIYTSGPSSLVFEESYHFRGKYYYPFKRVMTLGKENFFGLSFQTQIQSLTNFILTSSYEALGWQISDERARIVPKSLLLGKKNIPQFPDTKYSIAHIPELMLKAYPLQDKLFLLLKYAIEKASESLFDIEVELIPNASVYNWNFRGWRMKFKDTNGKTQKGSSEYVWKIFFNDPLHIHCDKFDDDDFPALPSFIIDNCFLSAPETEQMGDLIRFVTEVLLIEKPVKRDPFVGN